MSDVFTVRVEERGGVGLLTLNRPQALHALTPEMVAAMDQALARWAVNSAIRAVIVQSSGGRAFCAGGDVKAAAIEARETQGAAPGARAFFRAEYTLNHRVHTFPKPYIALIDGIVMGGGVGISAHGTHRVITENTLFAMPETGIGFFPDVGGGYFLPRCPGRVGTYLGLTGARLGAADALYCGFGTHFVPSVTMADLTQALCVETDIDAVLSRFAAPPPAAPLAAQRGAIDRCFSFDRVEDIFAALAAEKTPWGDEVLQTLRAQCPASLKAALRQIRQGAGMDFAAVMRMEYALSRAMLARPDFYEGVRAALIDKDRAPRWSPARAEDVPDTLIDEYFQGLGPEDLALPEK